PHGLAGLLIAAILAAAMSNLSAALNSLATSSVLDIILRFRIVSDPIVRMRFARTMTVGWAAVLFALALLPRHSHNVLQPGLSIASVAYGAMLGVFLLGMLSQRATGRGAAVGMLAGLAVNLLLWLVPGWMERHLHLAIAWTWYVPAGALVTCTIGWLASIPS